MSQVIAFTCCEIRSCCRLLVLKKDDEDNERGELEILPTDNLLVTAKTEDEISQLEIYVYDESEENLYVHHDLMLPNFPLCLEWLDFPPVASSKTATPGFGNYIAVGTLDPEIEIWSLDVLEAMYPASVLGRPETTKAHVPTAVGTGKKKRKKTKHRTPEKGYHVDAVLGLSWNKAQRNLLASASADRTVKLWDLSRSPVANGEGGDNEAGAIRSFDVHKDKVQAVQWNAAEPSVLLTGSYDRTVRTFDSRAPTGGVGAAVGSDVEALRWDPWEDYGFYVRPPHRPVHPLPPNPPPNRSHSKTVWYSISTRERYRRTFQSPRPRASPSRRTTARHPPSTSTPTSQGASSPAAQTSWLKSGTSQTKHPQGLASEASVSSRPEI